MILDTEKSSFKSWMYHLYYEHLLAATLGWQRLFRQRYQTVGAVILIGLALAICLIFGLVLRMTYQVQLQIEQTPNITIFPNTALNHQDYEALITRLSAHEHLKKIKVHSAKDLIEELLDKNVAQDFWQNIPGVITASSIPNLHASVIMQIKKELEQDHDIVAVEFDQLWHAKITKLMRFAHVISWIIGGVLVSSVVLMINYSIRLLMEKYKQEISVLYHLGASSQFIQRPYLYQGFFLGCFGALFATFSLFLPIFLLREQILLLIELYEVNLPLSVQDLMFFSYVLIGVIMFSWICSYSSTRKWLKLFELELI
jgi:cell division transport system permease protein